MRILYNSPASRNEPDPLFYFCLTNRFPLAPTHKTLFQFDMSYRNDSSAVFNACTPVVSDATAVSLHALCDLKRVNTITKQRGNAIREKRRGDKENVDAIIRLASCDLKRANTITKQRGDAIKNRRREKKENQDAMFRSTPCDLKRVNTITKQRGDVIRIRRREEKENTAIVEC
jgi:hypothetical protein